MAIITNLDNIVTGAASQFITDNSELFKGEKGDTGEQGIQGETGDGFTGGSYNASTGQVTFTSDDGLGFTTSDLRGADGADGDVTTGKAIAMAMIFG